ncbi:MAG: hypothetical protein ACR2IS_07540, partial [Nitrososphaeraceae archaeon]
MKAIGVSLDMVHRSSRSKGRDIRNDARDSDYPSTLPQHNNNGEEDDYYDAQGNRNFIGNYSKSLPHHPENDVEAGEVINRAYRKLIEATETGDPGDFEDIPLGSASPPLGSGRVQDPQKLTNPLSGIAYELEGLDSYAVDPGLVPPAPRIDGPRAAGEMAELYWMALCRDVNFRDFNNDQLIATAVADLSSTRYSQPSWPVPVTPNTVFRGETMGDMKGPYVSQFLIKGNVDVDRPDENTGIIKYGSLGIDQRQLTVTPGS